jgi:membrane-associated phospholipid phosphatase
MLVFSLVTAGYLSYKKCRRCALLLIGAMLFNAAILALIRTFVHSTRPLNSIIIIDLPSFPSGHVMGAVVFFGLLTCFMWKLWKSPKVRVLSGLSYLAIALIVGFDRIYLNVHWLSDVLGAYSFGIFTVALSILIFEETGTEISHTH